MGCVTDLLKGVVGFCDDLVLRFLNHTIPIKISIKWQMLLAFIQLLFISIGLVLMICLSSLFALGNNTYSAGSTAVLNLVKSDLLATSESTSQAIHETLNIISESIVMAGAAYSYSLVNSNSSILSPQASYREYNFVLTSASSLRPSDCSQGPLSTRSGGRFPSIPGFTDYGSLEYSSVYLGEKVSGTMSRKANGADWDSLLSSSSGQKIRSIIEQLAYEDLDFSVAYSNGPTETVMFYQSTVLCSSGSSSCLDNYAAIHRTYPGIQKDTTPSYDPGERPWFKKAPPSGVYLYGPYVESFTKQLVLTISSRSDVPSLAGYTSSSITMVSAAVLLIDRLKKIVTSVEYPKGGHGALVTNTKDWTLVVWSKPGSNLEPYDSSSGTFRNLASVDANLASSLGKSPLTASKRFEYTDESGTRWIVSALPFFPSTDYSTLPPGRTEALLALVFARYSDATASVDVLEKNIYSTQTKVLRLTLILIFSVAATIGLVIFIVVSYSLGPLKNIVSLSQEIIAIAAEEEENKDFTQVVNKSFLDLNRRDEVGLLAVDFFHLVCTLHNTNVVKRARPKFPKNPFHSSREESDESTSWDKFYEKRASANLTGHFPATTITPTPDKKSGPNEDDTLPARLEDLDVLGAMMRSASASSAPPQHHAHHEYQKIVPEVSTSGAMMRASASATPPEHHAHHEYQKIVPEMSVASEVRSQDDCDIGSGSGPGTEIVIEMTEVRPFQRVEAALNVVVPVLSTRPKLQMWQSIRVRVYILCLLLWLALLAVMVVTVVVLRDEGTNWMNATTADIVSSEKVQLNTLAILKSTFSQSFFAKITLSVSLFAATSSRVLTKTYARAAFSTSTYLPSYSMDSSYDYSLTGCGLPSSVASTDSSGYFISSDQPNQNPPTCLGKDSDESKLTSLVDFKFRSLFYTGNIISNIQIGLSSSGYLRQFPFKKQDLFAPQTNCLVDPTARGSSGSNCDLKFNSCSAGNYPPYDARCRSWYVLGAEIPSSQVSFTYPRVSSSGSYVVSAYSPLRDSANSLKGVAVFNVLASNLARAINSAAIMQSGYLYLVDGQNVTKLVVHPKAPYGSTELVQAEALSGPELATLKLILTSVDLTGSSSTCAQYTKQGVEWCLCARAFSAAGGTVKYVAVATLPYSDLTRSANAIASTISNTIAGMIAAFVVSMLAILLFIASFSRAVSERSVEPFLHLQTVCEAISEDRLANLRLPSSATSSDLRLLLDAFGNLIIAMRFGSEAFARDNVSTLKQTFSEALALYSATNNQRGIGASSNNLAYVEMSYGNFETAEALFQRAISNAEELVQTSEGDPKRLFRAKRILSDRRGNLAVLFLEQAAKFKGTAQSVTNTRFSDAFQVLEQGMLFDKQQGYIKGIVVKQGTLGQYYCKQGEFADALRVFSSCLEFVRSRNDAMFTGAVAGARAGAGASGSGPGRVFHWDESEIAAAEQVALLNLALLHVAQCAAGKQHKGRDGETCERKLIMSLTHTPWMDPSTARKAITALHAELLKSGKTVEANQLMLVAKEEGFALSESNGPHAAMPKRVGVVLDYSGSMSGTKIHGAVDNLLIIFDEHISNEDQIALWYFDGRNCPQPVAMQRKDSDAQGIRDTIDKLRRPGGGTNLYDAIWVACQSMSENSIVGCDFLIVLTDGIDGQSRLKLPSLLEKLRSPDPPVPTIIVVGVGSDVEESILRSIAEATTNGLYIFASADKEGISKAFSKVATAISGQIVLEDF